MLARAPPVRKNKMKRKNYVAAADGTYELELR